MRARPTPHLPFPVLALVLAALAACEAASEPAVTEASCAASSACELYGDCGVGASGDCAPTTAAHCADAKTMCIDRGLCALDGNTCVATDDAGCRISRNCKKYGLCGLSDDGRYCVARSEADCQNSEQCRVFMECTLNLGKCLNHGSH